MPGGGGNLSELIANAGQGGTLKLRPGIYQGGVVVSRPIRIVAETQAVGSQVVIQSEGKECLSVRAKGVVVQNIQFWCKGIGDLPAISVAEGGDLEMEGCKIESTSEVGLRVTGNASIKTLGSTFTTTNGIAVLVKQQAHASFTQSSFSNAQIGLGVGSAATAELHSCAFEGLGIGVKDGTIMTVVGQETQVAGDDCHFTNNIVGINVRDKASLSLTNCTFKGNAGGSASAGLIAVRDAQANIRKSTLVDSSPYAINVMSNASLTLEDTEISGSRTAGLIVGERNASPAYAKVRNSRFNRNAIGVGIVAGSSAEIEDSECSENNEGIVVLEQGSRLQLKKTALVSNRDHGLQVYANAEATVTDSDIRNNARGALSGVPHKASQRAVLKLEDCRIGGNQVFGVGACAQSQLILTRCSFAEDTKKNIYRESGAIVQTDAAPELTPASEEATEATPRPESTAKTKSSSRRTTTTKQKRPEEDISRVIRSWVLPPP
jgi:nitrous oxidase accessory protein NosD